MTAVQPSVVSHTVLMTCKLITIVYDYKWEQSLKNNQITTLEFNFTENHEMTQLLFSLYVADWSIGVIHF